MCMCNTQINLNLQDCFKIKIANIIIVFAYNEKASTSAMKKPFLSGHSKSLKVGGVCLQLKIIFPTLF